MAESPRQRSAWILGTVFLRFCEDNGLIELPSSPVQASG